MPEAHFTIKRRIRALEEFERKYGEYLFAKRQRDAGDKPVWSTRQFQTREEELKKLAPRVDAAIDASGVERVELHKSWPDGHRTLVADDVATLIFGGRKMGFGKNPFTDDLRQEVLDALPRQIDGLKVQLKRRRTVGQRFGEAGQRLRESAAWVASWWGRREHPFLLAGIGGAATILAAIVVAVISG